MKEDKRKYHLFSLCGLNCGLCPRYQTEGSSKCPGCGGSDFHLKHPACVVITCTRKHDNVEYCFECSLYPCKKYSEASKTDSFISYRNVLSDFNKAKTFGIENYQKELDDKVMILENLIENYNDGRKKAFYCLAINLLSLSAIKSIMEQISKEVDCKDLDVKDKIKIIDEMFEAAAEKEKVELKLRK